MQSSCWKLEDSVARLRLPPFHARLDLEHPERGVSNIELDSAAVASDAILGILWFAATTRAAGPPSDCYLRDSDLVATYPETVEHPVRVQIYWRAADHEQHGVSMPGLDVCVSVQTELLDSNPALTVTSHVAAAEVLRLVDPAHAEFALVEQGSTPCSIESEQAPSCVVARLADMDRSYVEFAHPQDSSRTTIGLGDSPSTLRIAHEVFHGPLEKGVILRGRLRGLYLPRQDDLAIAARMYQEFLAQPLPLST